MAKEEKKISSKPVLPRARASSVSEHLDDNIPPHPMKKGKYNLYYDEEYGDWLWRMVDDDGVPIYVQPDRRNLEEYEK